ncbi:Uncharacterised protein [uncultured archaeon]|nr:Uncharacterised protein [uncultured archaeon]
MNFMNNDESDEGNYEKLLEGLIKLSLNTNTKELFVNILDCAKGIINANIIHIRVSDKFEGKLKLEYWDKENNAPNNKRFNSISESEAIAGYAFSQGRSFIANNLDNDTITNQTHIRFREYIRDLEKSIDNKELILYLDFATSTKFR